MKPKTLLKGYLLFSLLVGFLYLPVNVQTARAALSSDVTAYDLIVAMNSLRASNGLPALVEEIKKRGIRSVAVPPLGCGLGGLDWSEIRPKIERAFAELPDVLDVAKLSPKNTNFHVKAA